jgi:DNA transposition AAA+ family ATPase
VASPLIEARDLDDRGDMGLVLIGMPGLEKRMARYPQLCSRVGFAHECRALGTEEMRFMLEYHWQRCGLKLQPTDFADAEGIAAIVRMYRSFKRYFIASPSGAQP